MRWWRRLYPVTEHVLWTRLQLEECRERLQSRAGARPLADGEQSTKQDRFAVQVNRDRLAIEAVGPGSSSSPRRATGRLEPLANGTRVTVRLPLDRTILGLGAIILVGLFIWLGLLWLVVFGGAYLQGSTIVFATVAAVVFNMLLLFALMVAYVRRPSTRQRPRPAIVRFIAETLEAEEETPATNPG